MSATAGMAAGIWTLGTRSRAIAASTRARPALPPGPAWASSAGTASAEALPGEAHLDADPDLPLIAAMATGDERALAELVRRHGARLRAIASGYAAAAAEIDDVVQETFFTAWRNVARFEPRGAKVSTWLCRITINRCIDLERRRKLRRFVGLEDDVDPADPAVAADVGLADRTELAAVMADVRRLPERQRAAILLAADGERSNAEIAEALGVSLGAAEQLLVRARRTLRERATARDGEARS